MKYLVSVLLCIFVLVSGSVLAIDLQTAKAKGLVGETPGGYLAAVVSPSAEVEELIADINGKRKASYRKVAEKNSISLEKVEHLAGKKAMEKSAPGHYVKIDDVWEKK